MNNLQIKFFSVGCGDAIAIRFKVNDNDEKCHNILIDGGKKRYYNSHFKPEIEAIYRRGEIINLWIVSHIHDDHIGGITGFIEEEELQNKIDVSEIQFWFNYIYYNIEVFPTISSQITVEQGTDLRTFLCQKAKVCNVNNTCGIELLPNVKITILSPDKKGYEKLVEELENEGVKYLPEPSTQISPPAEQTEYRKKIEEFNIKTFTEDTDPLNGSSIAFLFEYKEFKMLFLADSHPNIIKQSLLNLGYSEDNKIPLNYMQLPHHGSKKNTSSDLLALINCENFVISANGIGNKPYKETLVRVLRNNYLQGKNTNFLFNHREIRSSLRTIFAVDGKEAFSKYNFKCNFDLIQNNHLLIEF